MKQTIHCRLQSRLGGLDRVLGALTHRGFIPLEFTCVQEENAPRLHCVFSIDCEDEQMLDKLLKFLAKQVYVLSAERVEEADDTGLTSIQGAFGKVKPFLSQPKPSAEQNLAALRHA